MKKALVVVAATAAVFATAAALPRAAQAQRPRIIECDSNRGRPGWCRTFGQGRIKADGADGVQRGGADHLPRLHQSAAGQA